MTQHLHVVAFDVPYPPDYGGAIDVFYKLKALFEAGVQVKLHIFLYGDREQQKILEKYAQIVYYYKRDTTFFAHGSWLPYIVNSRKHADLLTNLQADTHPILFEGLHTCAWLSHERLRSRLKLVRMHNVEWKYYESLAALSTNLVHRLFFKLESRRLKAFERAALPHADILLTISPNEESYFQRYNLPNQLLYPFHQHDTVSSQLGRGKYAIFYGNLSVVDNADAAVFLVKNVFAYSDFSLIIAGKNPPHRLQSLIANYPHIQLIDNPATATMLKLQKEAHIHVLWTFQNAGTKLKWLDALYSGRFVITNELMLPSPTFSDVCKVVKTAEEALTWVEKYRNQPFTQALKNNRSDKLSCFHNATQIEALLLHLKNHKKNKLSN